VTARRGDEGEEGGGGERQAVKGGEEEDVKVRRMVIKSDVGEDDAQLVNGGGGCEAISTASPGIRSKPDAFRASKRVLSRCLRCQR
jgi:hypothetical protein